MPQRRRILITGAMGNLGAKLRSYWESQHDLSLIDVDPRGDPSVRVADLSQWSDDWLSWFAGIDTVVHLAGNPVAYADWTALIGPNVDALINVFLASARMGVKRIIYASSNHVMGGYQDRPDVPQITTDLPPMPGARYIADGQPRHSGSYGAAKLFGERLGKCWADTFPISVIAVRIGWVWKGENRPADLPAERGSWFRQMWLSNRDFLHLMDCCLLAGPHIKFAIVNGMSRNAGTRWDLNGTHALIGFEPLDGLREDW